MEPALSQSASYIVHPCCLRLACRPLPFLPGPGEHTMADGCKAKSHNYKRPASDQRLFRDGLVERRLKDVRNCSAHGDCSVPDAGGKDSKQEWVGLVDRHPMRHPEHNEVMQWHDPQKPSNGRDELGGCKAVGAAMCPGRDWIKLTPEDASLHPNHPLIPHGEARHLLNEGVTHFGADAELQLFHRTVPLNDATFENLLIARNGVAS
mmetsp:Transcript_3058/g.7257  ORF Transcript_3058/g.7257 Transcript_3058/m.7257 type:complete len:207 (-) Transcript_3058:415-1035(-)